MKKRTSRKLLYAITTLAATLLSQGAYANISPKAFKGVTKRFKPGKEFFSPTLGEAALESSLIENFRFFGNFTSAFKEVDGTRVHDYAHDKSKDDPVWTMVRIFFPSTAGQLSGDSTRVTNFGKNVDSVETIAMLLNYVNDLREGKEVDEDILKTDILSTLKKRPTFESTKEGKQLALEKERVDSLVNKIKGIGGTTTEDFKKDLNVILKGVKKGNPLIKIIRGLSSTMKKNFTPDQLKETQEKIVGKLEEALTKKTTLKQNKFHKKEKGFQNRFAKETLQPLLTAIKETVTKEGNDEKDSLYASHTAEQIISAFFGYKFNKQQDIWDMMSHLDESIVDKSMIPKSVDELKEEDLPDIETHETYDMDDVFALEMADIWTSVTPYREGSAPLSNGNTYKYDRQTGKSLKTEKTFADCVEIAGRHLMNMLLYDPYTTGWNLSHIEKHIKDNSPDNKYFENFKNFYATQTPNLANAGDIEMRSLWNTVVGDLNAFDKEGKVSYALGTNELRPGFINIIRVFEKIFSLELDEFPEGDLPHKIQWLEGSFKKLFKVLDPSKSLSMDFSKVKEKEGEISGNIPMVVSDPDKELFSFTFYVKHHVHSQIKGLKNLKKTAFKEYSDELEEHKTSIHTDTAEESIWLLSTSADLKTKKVHNPLYLLFQGGLQDNDAKIKLLETLDENVDSWKDQWTPTALRTLQGILGNVLKEVSWEDEAVCRKISPVVLSLLEKDDFKEVLSENVMFLYISYNKKLKEVDLTGLESLKKLTLLDSIIETIEGLNTLKNLETLELWNTNKLKEVDLTGLESLKTLDLWKSNIKKIGDFNTLKNLETLKLSCIKDLKEVDLTGLESLKKLDLSESTIEVIVLKNLHNLEELNLCTLSHIKKIVFEGDFSQLTTLSFEGTKNNFEIEGLELLTNVDDDVISTFKTFRKVSDDIDDGGHYT